MKKVWQVWTEDDIKSNFGMINGEKILFEGTESACKKWAEKKPSLHVGYLCNGVCYPEKGDVWKGRIADDVKIEVVSVSKKKNLVRARIIISNGREDVGRVLDYIYESFNQYYCPEYWTE